MDVHGSTEFGRLITETDLEKLDFYGDEYLVQRIQIESERLSKEKAFQLYISKALELLTFNTQKFGGYEMPCSLSDILDPKENETNQQEVSVEEIKKRQHEAFVRLGGVKK